MDRAADCYHCGEPVPGGEPFVARIRDGEYPMCCIGCKAVAEFIDSSGLTAFYDYRENPDSDHSILTALAGCAKKEADLYHNGRPETI